MNRFKFLRGNKKNEYIPPGVYEFEPVPNPPINDIDMYLAGLSPHIANTVRLYLLEAKSIIDDTNMYHVNREYMYAIIRNIISKFFSEDFLGMYSVENNGLRVGHFVSQIDIPRLLFNFHCAKATLEVPLQGVLPNIDTHAEMCIMFCNNYVYTTLNKLIEERNGQQE
jgi:hypothetical protein